MLKLNPDPTFQADVQVTVPGKLEPEIISLTFKYRGKKELLEWYEGNEGRDEVDIFMDMAIGWEGVDSEFNRDNVKLFLNNFPAAAGEIVRKYSSLSMASRVKN